MENTKVNEITESVSLIHPEELREHWQGHRRLTRRVIEAFPEDQLFNYSIGGMRTFSELAMELIHMGAPCVYGIATRKWKKLGESVDSSLSVAPKTKEEILQLWDWATEQIDATWKLIPLERYREISTIDGQYEGVTWSHFFYFIDNEVHHRGQGYVYLRSLGIEPPAFWER